MPVEPEHPQDPSGADALTPYEASLDRRKPGMLGRLRDAQEEVRVGLEALADGTASITTRMGLDFITPDAESGGVDSDTERAREFGAIYADLESYFWFQLHPPTYESVDYTLDEDAGWSLVYDFFDTGIIELLEGEDIHMPSPESQLSIPLPEPDTAFIRLSDIPQGRTIRLGITFEGKSESQPSTDFGIEIDLAETDGTVRIYESRTSPDDTPQGAEERVKTEKAQSTPDQMRNIARILDKYSHSGTITRRATRRARAEGVIDPNQAVVIITTERVSGEMVGDAVLDAANIEVDAGQAHHSIDDHSET